MSHLLVGLLLTVELRIGETLVWLDVLGEHPHQSIVSLLYAFLQVAGVEVGSRVLLRALLLLPLLDVADHSHRQHGVEDMAQVVRPVEEEFEEGLAE